MAFQEEQFPFVEQGTWTASGVSFEQRKQLPGRVWQFARCTRHRGRSMIGVVVLIELNALKSPRGTEHSPGPGAPSRSSTPTAWPAIHLSLVKDEPTVLMPTTPRTGPHRPMPPNVHEKIIMGGIWVADVGNAAESKRDQCGEFQSDC